MKTKMAVLLAMMATTAHAAIDLDHAVHTGFQSDRVFPSTNDPKVVYYFPIALNRFGEVVTSEVDSDHLNVRFSAVADPRDKAIIRSKLDSLGDSALQLDISRPLEFTIENGTNVSRNFDPQLQVLGDLNIGEPTIYSLTVKRFPHLFGGSEATKLFNLLFGASGEDDIGHIVYVFDAIAEGKPYLGKTSIPILVGEKSGMVVTPIRAALMAESPFLSLSDFAELANAPVPNLPIVPQPESTAILRDSADHCWDNVKPGQICLKAK